MTAQRVDLQDIKRCDMAEKVTEVLHLADEVNHLTWVREDVARRSEPFDHPCEMCGVWHEWRRVWVKV